MISSNKLTTVIESYAGEAKRNGASDRDSVLAGVRGMHHEIMESLGIERDGFGRPKIKQGSARADEYDMVELLESIGEAFGFRRFARSVLDPREQYQFHGATAMEAGPGIDPTAFGAISLWTATAAGLVDAKVIEKFDSPMSIVDKLIEVIPTRKNGETVIGVTGIGDKAQVRNPGEPHARAGFGQQKITTPELEERALAVEVTQEADFYDLTGQVMMVAGGVGDELFYRRESSIIDLVIGVTNPFVLNGTGYNTYNASTPWINSQSNPFSNYQDIDDALELFRAMKDLATQKEISVLPNAIIHHTSRLFDFRRELNATETREVSGNTTTISPNPLNGTNYQLVSSPILDNRMTAANGLNLSASNAKARWFFGDFPKAFKWMEAWPVRTTAASPNEHAMRDRGIVAAFFSNYRGVGAVFAPQQTSVQTA